MGGPGSGPRPGQRNRAGTGRGQGRQLKSRRPRGTTSAGRQSLKERHILARSMQRKTASYGHIMNKTPVAKIRASLHKRK